MTFAGEISRQQAQQAVQVDAVGLRPPRSSVASMLDESTTTLWTPCATNHR
jgi:hypothetical protein